jgi:creatinine amidohydrolase
MTEKVFLWDMTYEEAGKAFKEADFIVLPTGSMEQHSIHLPVSVDNIRAEELTKYLVTHSGDLKMVMLPTLYYGQSNHHMRFPGTITLSEETYIKVLKEIAWSVKQHGGERLLIVNFHGGNVAPIQVARLMIERDVGLKVYFVPWSAFGSDIVKEWAPYVPFGHSGFYETSMILKYRPDLVVREKMKKQEQRFYRERGERMPTRGTAAAYFDDNHITGGIGDPTLADAELAEKIIPVVNQRIIDALKEDMKYE